jgi:NAD(P)-dependent dehydrogenase (short-subunit alcohol dehydrogenase family)
MGSMLDMPSEKFDKVMENNIKSNQLLCNLVIPEMVKRNDGSIIIISSIGGLKGSNLLGAYNISKAADIMMVKNIAAEFGKNNIRANSIAPGLIKTDFAKALWENPEILKAVLGNTPMQRIGEPDEIAGAAVMLSSKAGEYINGQTIVIDGGTTIV